MSEKASGVEPAQPGEVRIRRALLSVSDKRGLVELARGLRELDVEIVSTGGSARELSEAGIEVRAIEDYTGFPEIMDGRVKTIQPAPVRGSAGAARRRGHLRQAADQRDRAGRPRLREPVPVRGDDREARGERRRGDREHRHRRPDDDPRGGEEQRFRGGAHGSRRLRPGARRAARQRRPAQPRHQAPLAASAFATTARYDAAISTWFAAREAPAEELPATFAESFEKVMDLRYGENPHQRAAFYARAGAPTHLLDGVDQLHGKELSFNNLLDLNSARELVEEFDRPGMHDRQAQQPVWLRGRRRRPPRLRARLRVRPGERLRRRDRGQPPRRRSGRRAALQAVHRGAARAGLRARGAVLLQEKKNVRLLELATGPRQRASSKASPSSAAGSCRAATSSTRRVSRCRCERSSSPASRSGRTCCSAGSCAATCARTRS